MQDVIIKVLCTLIGSVIGVLGNKWWDYLTRSSAWKKNNYNKMIDHINSIREAALSNFNEEWIVVNNPPNWVNITDGTSRQILEYSTQTHLNVSYLHIIRNLQSLNSIYFYDTKEGDAVIDILIHILNEWGKSTTILSVNSILEIKRLFEQSYNTILEEYRKDCGIIRERSEYEEWKRLIRP